jgi:hypothetical protein
MELTSRLGMEKIQREALLILANVTQGLNTKITAMQPTWTAEDDQLYAALGRSNPDWTVEQVLPANFHPGTAKGIMKWPVERFPNVCTICYQAFSPNDDDNDQGEFYSDRLAIEITVKSEESEEEVNSRIQKTLDAAHLVLWDYRTLNNTVPEISTPPDVSIGDVQIRRHREGIGADWYWQGGALTYIVNKYVVY